jgi:hypothetical protein
MGRSNNKNKLEVEIMGFNYALPWEKPHPTNGKQHKKNRSLS